MNVVFDVTPLQTDHRFRGIGTYTRELLRHLRVLEPSIETWGFDIEIPELSAVPDRSAGSARKHALAQWMSLAVLGARSLGSGDLLHVTNYTSAPVRPKGPYVATVFDLIPLRVPEHYLPTRRHRFRYKWYLRHLQRADRVLAISSAVASDCVDKLSIPRERIHVTPLAPQTLPEPTGRHPFDRRPFAVVIGTPDPHKNVDFGIEVVAHLTEATDVFVVMTGELEESAQVLIRRAATKGVELQHLGHVSRQRLSDLYASACVSLFPSLYEGFGIPALEVLRVGGRLIVSDRGGLPETVGRAAPVLPLELDAWVDMADRFVGGTQVSDPDHARQHAANFTWERTARSTLEAYERVHG